ncbi:unnamed protein product [Vitrella brassicaformis CCMP3155]|uniref:Uncharacterized protein n=1 Tax=Vitrella brassicaformis (strain CCMP3155) TaxID=1169540 RepID=A0A0G4G6I3_VITBC|nr:unnamed protein product [Vitrella brassicaformis CCMP3155]|eukprot:CEM23956.1 unnamed protein product [Vitrella brassicaformis CCMP3155]
MDAFCRVLSTADKGRKEGQKEADKWEEIGTILNSGASKEEIAQQLGPIFSSGVSKDQKERIRRFFVGAAPPAPRARAAASARQPLNRS